MRRSACTSRALLRSANGKANFARRINSSAPNCEESETSCKRRKVDNRKKRKLDEAKRRKQQFIDLSAQFAPKTKQAANAIFDSKQRLSRQVLLRFVFCTVLQLASRAFFSLRELQTQESRFCAKLASKSMKVAIVAFLHCLRILLLLLLRSARLAIAFGSCLAAHGESSSQRDFASEIESTANRTPQRQKRRRNERQKRFDCANRQSIR